MLDKFRKISSSLGMKICLGLLAASLIWSVTSQSGRGQYVAKVADNYIYKSEFLRAKRHFARAISQEQGAMIDPETLNKFVLDSLIKSALLKVESDRLGLVIGDSVVMEEISKMPAFQNKDGKFDKEIFKRLLASNGVSESEFIKQRKEDIAGSILDSIFSPYDPSRSFVNNFHAYKDQERQVELVTITQDAKAKADAAARPVTEAEIANFYEKYQGYGDFAVPETRDISYVIISPAKAKDQLATLTAEKVLHELIKKVEDELAGGMSLQEVAKKFGLKVESLKGIVAGQVGIANVPNKILAEAFLLKENQPSDAQQFASAADPSSAGASADYFVVNVDRINPAHQKDLDASLKQEITKMIERDRASGALYKVASKIRDALADGTQNLAAVLAENSNVSAKTITLSKTAKQTDTSPELVFAVFRAQKKDEHTNLYPAPEQVAVQFAIVKSIVEPKKLSEQQFAALHGQVSGYMTSAIHHEFLAYLYSKYDVKVYPDAIKIEE